MKNKFWNTLAISTVGASVSHAGEGFSEGADSKSGLAKGGLIETAGESRWKFGTTAGIILGVDAEFSSLGRWVSPNTPTFNSSGVDRSYDDGFNNLDSSGNAGGLTWNWGYQDDAQYDATASTLALSTYDSARNASVDDSNDPHFGLNFFGLYEIGEAGKLYLTPQPTRWGIKGGLGYQHIGVANRSTLTADLRQSTDTFALNGVIPPLASYNGSFTGPGSLISDAGTFSQQITRGGATVTGSREVEADLFLASIGPYLELPLSEKFSLFTEGGINLGFARGNYAFTSTTTIPGIGSQTTTGDESDTQFVGGVYLGVGASYELTERWSIYSDAKYQYLSPIEIEANGSKAELNFNSSFALNFGAMYQF